MLTKADHREISRHRRYWPNLAEVWKGYRAMGTDSPLDLDIGELRRQAELAEHATLPHKAAKQGHHRLLGSIYYDLGVATHGLRANEAEQLLGKAERHLSALKPTSTRELISQQRWLTMIALMIERAGVDERRTHSLQIESVRTLGKLTTAGAEVVSKMRNPERKETYGDLVETAFAGTFLADISTSRTIIGLPTTPRQNGPASHDLIPYKSANTSRLTCSAVNFNLLTYTGDNSTPEASTPIQIKSKYPGSSEERYDQGISMLYADRDLAITCPTDLRCYGEALSLFDGKPDAQVAAAISSIRLALGQEI